jgi:hypothetical protein
MTLEEAREALKEPNDWLVADAVIASVYPTSWQGHVPNAGTLRGAVATTVKAAREQAAVARLTKQRDTLRRAIGVCVPSCLRVLLTLLPADAEVDRDVVTKTLARVDAAMASVDHQ